MVSSSEVAALILEPSKPIQFGEHMRGFLARIMCRSSHFHSDGSQITTKLASRCDPITLIGTETRRTPAYRHDAIPAVATSLLAAMTAEMLSARVSNGQIRYLGYC